VYTRKPSCTALIRKPSCSYKSEGVDTFDLTKANVLDWFGVDNECEGNDGIDNFPHTGCGGIHENGNSLHRSCEGSSKLGSMEQKCFQDLRCENMS
jgi:hypothetical protein